MRETRIYYVYIMTNKSGTLYTGVTGNIQKRVWQHKTKLVPGFASKYNITRLLHYECFTDVHCAIRREKVIKGWVRQKKLELIGSTNPNWLDLGEEWYDEDVLR
jgi:putative endonuclease